MAEFNDRARHRGGPLCPTSRQPAITREAEIEAAAGLPGTSKAVESELRRDGIDPDRLSIFNLGRPAALLHYPYPPWP